jgi:hypothetical protein
MNETAIQNRPSTIQNKTPSPLRDESTSLPRYHPAWPVLPDPLTPPTAAVPAAIGCPGNGGLPERTTPRSTAVCPGTCAFHPSAQERTSAASFPAGLPVTDPASLEAAPRLLFSVSAFASRIAKYYTRIGYFVKQRVWASIPLVQRSSHSTSQQTGGEGELAYLTEAYLCARLRIDTSWRSNWKQDR